MLDVGRGAEGELVLMQSIAPFETRRDLSLRNNTACPALRRKVRKLFLTGMDLDLIVRVHRQGSGGSRGGDCVMTITQEVEDKK